MFYTNDLLSVTGGKFAVIWKAALMKRKLSKREILSADIEELCYDLTSQIRPTDAGGMVTVQGFSLRLSSQLMHGILLVYYEKVNFLLKEANLAYQSIWAYRRKAKKAVVTSINLPSQNNGDVQQIYEEEENPLFGQMTLDRFNEDILHEFADPTVLQEGYFTESAGNRMMDASLITLPEEIPIRMDDAEFGTAIDPASNIMTAMDYEGEDSLFNTRGSPPSMFTDPLVMASTNAITPSQDPTESQPDRPNKARQSKKHSSDGPSTSGESEADTHGRQSSEEVATADIPSEDMAAPLLDQEQPPPPEEEAVIPADTEDRAVNEQRPESHIDDAIVLEPLHEEDLIRRPARRLRTTRRRRFDREIDMPRARLAEQIRSDYNSLSNYIDSGHLRIKNVPISAKESLNAPMRRFDTSRLSKCIPHYKPPVPHHPRIELMKSNLYYMSREDINSMDIQPYEIPMDDEHTIGDSALTSQQLGEDFQELEAQRRHHSLDVSRRSGISVGSTPSSSSKSSDSSKKLPGRPSYLHDASGISGVTPLMMSAIGGNQEAGPSGDATVGPFGDNPVETPDAIIPAADDFNMIDDIPPLPVVDEMIDPSLQPSADVLPSDDAPFQPLAAEDYLGATDRTSTVEDTCRWIQRQLRERETGQVSFNMLAHGTSRKVAATLFSDLLVLVKRGDVVATQESWKLRQHADIFIREADQ